MTTSRRTIELCLVPVLHALIVPALRGQQRIWEKDADGQTKSYGEALAFMPDQNGDGIDDVLLGYTGKDCNSWSGMVYLLSGADGAELKSMCGGDADGGCAFGSSIALMADLDQDGTPEFIVGDPLYDEVNTGSNAGTAFLYSGATWQVVTQFLPEDREIRFGSVVATSPDMDGDGIDDIAISAPRFAYAFPTAAGRTYFYSSATHNLLRKHTGEKDLDYFGGNFARIRDQTADGIDEYAVSSILTDSTDFGEVELFNGSTGAFITSWTPSQRNGFGLTVDAGDLDGDSISDLLICASGMASEAGYAFAFSGSSWTPLFELRGALADDKFGVSAASIGDMNSDGVSEFLIGAFTDDRLVDKGGSATLYSGRTARALYTFFGDYSNALFGANVYGGSDLNSDGIVDVIIQALETPPKKGKRMGGRVTAFAGNDLFLQADVRTPLPGDTVTIATRGGESGALTLLTLIDVSGTPLFLPLFLSTLDANGESALAASIPAAASGLDFTLLAYAQKHAGGHGLIDSWTETISVQ